MKRIITIMTLAGIFLFGGISHAQVQQQRTQQRTQQNQEKFQSINKSNVPDKVKQAVNKDFKNSEIDEAYVNNNKIYKLKLKAKQNQTNNRNQMNERTQMNERNQNQYNNNNNQTVYYNEEGNRVNINENGTPF